MRLTLKPFKKLSDLLGMPVSGQVPRVQQNVAIGYRILVRFRMCVRDADEAGPRGTRTRRKFIIVYVDLDIFFVDLN